MYITLFVILDSKHQTPNNTQTKKSKSSKTLRNCTSGERGTAPPLIDWMHFITKFCTKMHYFRMKPLKCFGDTPSLDSAWIVAG